MVPPTPLASLSSLADRFATIIYHRQGPLLTPGPANLGLILFWSLLNSYILTTAEWIQHVVTIDRQFRALICFIRFAPEFVGRFWIPIFDSDRIHFLLGFRDEVTKPTRPTRTCRSLAALSGPSAVLSYCARENAVIFCFSVVFDFLYLQATEIRHFSLGN